MYKPLYIFLHVVKTGGTTINTHLKRYLTGFRDTNKHEQPKESDIFVSGHIFNFRGYGEHYFYPWREIRYITILRDPASWLVSIYHQDMMRKKKQIPFEEWYEQKKENTVLPTYGNRNRMTRYLREFLGCIDVSEMIERLKSFYCVMFTENLDIYLAILFKELGVPMAYKNQRVTGEYSKDDKMVIPKTYKLTKEMKHRIYTENNEDIRIYTEMRRYENKLDK